MNPNTVEILNTGFEAMAKEIEQRTLQGTAAIAYLEDAQTIDWQMSIRVFGKIESAPNDLDQGWNLIGMACSKAAESISTKIKSGSDVRPLRHGEVGFMGADVQKCGNGYVVAAFSGASSEEDFAVSQAAIASIVAKLSQLHGESDCL